ncbi:hypothetical protein BT63DRAFT_411493 [Microthyrium microscopicum]|uniref:Uncharacterized protein n=1 Tax=Microthyrium microscopicum TaxID=703497 RepID=A0A6A6UKF6_9PEZI|nr:hypothetical protein BT63DRAFT_411493 [Microthyrium microscopicum]
MSAPQPTSSGENQGRRASLTRAFSKIRQSFSKRSSISGESSSKTAALSSTQPAPAATSSTLPEAGPISFFGPELLEIDEQAEHTAAPFVSTGPISRGHDAQTRAVMHGNEFNLDVKSLGLELFDDGPRLNRPRVEKKIRMRIRHKCHKCETSFSQNKPCRKCQHERCRECPRDPMRRNRERSDLNQSIRRRESIVAETQNTDLKFNDAHDQQSLSPILYRSTQAPGMQGARIEYTCHSCESLFIAGTAQHCANCGHRKCDACPRKPADLVLPPENPSEKVILPGDFFGRSETQRVWKSPRQRVKSACHECKTVFQPSEKTCPTCKHTRCDLCVRKS